ncbi:arsenate reductase (glutaredoxin) [Roseiconus lacunae]|uniref:arsenate reductase (glutaredoxin) n=1 Tax=Roseiconus lacunae TaxID=2605694 RepID=UPI001E5FE5AA|nr:arsenate reductase (glutaredoxin) [Roseiconus lacunae]MCD0462222.1 arsenate reductase (glutaredoxin) [Roseiconus lacunae]
MTKIYHNPRCSKSREALQLLQSRGIEFDEVRYLDNPPTKTELRKVIKLLNLRPEQLVRRKEKLFKELGLDSEALSDSQWIDVMVEHPKLIERPIVVHGDRAAIGRPIGNIVELLDA